VLIGHLSDLHLRDDADVTAFERQLDGVVARAPDHVAITGDLLDRWQPRLLERALDALRSRGLLHERRLTVIHGNHDLASSGGHPRQRSDLWRLVLRFWDPPPLLQARRRRFYDTIGRAAPAVAAPAPRMKVLDGIRLAAIDTVPFPWRPLRMSRGGWTLEHAVGCARASDIRWLEALGDGPPLVVLLHHYPLAAPTFEWKAEGKLRYLVDRVKVPMAIPPNERERFWNAAASAGVRLVLCGHVHRARLEMKDGIAVGLNGQSGAEWAGRTVAYYDLSGPNVSMTLESG
jgi:3',5'-cyclic AMP phosphodiesterase CpdA